jgi:hypothetical protein
MEEAEHTPPEVVDEDGRPLPVLAEPRVVAQRPEAALAAPMAAAAGGLLAGFMAFVLARGLRNRPKRAVKIGGRRGKGLEVAASRSFLVDVHVLNKR